MPYRKIKVKKRITDMQRLASGHWIISYSGDTISLQVWDLERGTQVGEDWEDEETEVWDLEKGTQVGKEWEDNETRAWMSIALSPDGKTLVTSRSLDGVVKLWNVDTGKVIKRWTGQTKQVWSTCWSPDGGRVVGRDDEIFRVWDVKTGETILGPIKAGGHINAVGYSPDAKMIVTGGESLKIWDANSGELLKTIQGWCMCLAWTSDGKTLIASGRKFDTATWSEVAVLDADIWVISLSPNERILASTFFRSPSTDVHKTAQLWNLETNQPIGTPLHHEARVDSATFSADGKFLVTNCRDYSDNDKDDGHIYIWDISAIVKDAGLLSDIADATPRPAPKMTGARRMPPGFFDDALRDANLRIRLSQSNGPHNRPTPAPRQHTLGPISSFWRRSKPHTAERDTQPRWTQNLVSGMMRRRHGSDIELREQPPVIDVPCTAGQPRNYHATRKTATSSSRPSNTPHTTQHHNGAAQGTPSSSQLAPPTATASTLSAVAGAVGTTSRPRITIDSGWRARFMLWVCCMSTQTADGQH